jgi:hypothetical protein
LLRAREKLRALLHALNRRQRRPALAATHQACQAENSQQERSKRVSWPQIK